MPYLYNSKKWTGWDLNPRPQPAFLCRCYLCNVCRAIYGNKAELNRHILTHAGSAKGGEGMYSERSAKRVTLVVDIVKAITATAFILLPLAHW